MVVIGIVVAILMGLVAIGAELQNPAAGVGRAIASFAFAGLIGWVLWLIAKPRRQNVFLVAFSVAGVFTILSNLLSSAS